MATRSNAAKREAGKVSAKHTPEKMKVVTVNEADIWRGMFPERGSGYMRAKAALTAIAYPLMDNAKIEKDDGRIIVSFPVKIVLPKTFTKDEVDRAILELSSF